jgi:hypothetical protein
VSTVGRKFNGSVDTGHINISVGSAMPAFLILLGFVALSSAFFT